MWILLGGISEKKWKRMHRFYDFIFDLLLQRRPEMDPSSEVVSRIMAVFKR